MTTRLLITAGVFLGMSLVCVARASEITLPASKLRIREVGRALAGGGWNLWSNGGLGDWFEAEGDGKITVIVVARGEPAKGIFPKVRLFAGSITGNSSVREFTVDAKEFTEYRFRMEAPAGVFLLRVDFLNDFNRENEDRNLLVRELRISGARLADGAPEVKTATDAEIRKLRRGTIIINTKPGAAVKVTQLRHEFHFGTAISTGMFRPGGNAASKKTFRRVLKDNFNAAVHENALKWYATERQKGKLTWRDAETIVSWCGENDISVRGHCIFWCVDKYVQGWIKAFDDDELRARLKERALDVTRRFRGRIGEYDVNNEMLAARYYAGRLGDDIRVKMFQWAKQGDPEARLYLNEYGIVTPGNRNLAAYEKQIEWFLAKGAPVGGIGCQGHFGGTVDPMSVRTALDRLARFKLPIKITEFDVNVKDEAVKAKSLEDFYRVCFAHPAVEGILMWGFWEGAHWRPSAALWKKDWTPTPAAKVYRNLVFDEWWTKFEGKADDEGVCKVPAFFGKHRVSSAGKTVTVELRKKDKKTKVQLLP